MFFGGLPVCEQSLKVTSYWCPADNDMEKGSMEGDILDQTKDTGPSVVLLYSREDQMYNSWYPLTRRLSQCLILFYS